MKEPLKELSEEFKAVVRSGTSIRAKCELCDRTCFEDDATLDWEDGEFKSLQSSAEQDPNHYEPMDRVETGRIDGKDVVVNCICNRLCGYENWIWTHRHIIAGYVAAITKKKAEEAFSDEAEAEALKEGIETPDKSLNFIKCVACNGYFADELMKAQAGELFCEQCAGNKTLCPKCHKWISYGDVAGGLCTKCYEEEQNATPAISDPYPDADDLPF